jgi:hypothetical protein
MAHLEKALWTNIMGPERKSMVIPEATKKKTAYHEGGHALVSLFSKGTPPLSFESNFASSSLINPVEFVNFVFCVCVIYCLFFVCLFFSLFFPVSFLLVVDFIYLVILFYYSSIYPLFIFTC